MIPATQFNDHIFYISRHFLKFPLDMIWYFGRISQKVFNSVINHFFITFGPLHSFLESPHVSYYIPCVFINFSVGHINALGPQKRSQLPFYLEWRVFRICLEFDNQHILFIILMPTEELWNVCYQWTTKTNVVERFWARPLAFACRMPSSAWSGFFDL